jgi:transposase InsO family protein
MNPKTGEIRRIKLVTDNGGAFKGVAFARFIASRPELLHIRTRAKSPGQNGVRERGFGSLKYEHLYRVHEQIATVEDLYREAEAYRAVFNAVSPRYAPVTGFAVRLVAPTASTSGSEAGRLTS